MGPGLRRDDARILARNPVMTLVLLT